VKYRVNVENMRFGAIVEFGGLDAGNGAAQAFEASAGGDLHVGPGVLSFDVIGGYMQDAVNLGFVNSGSGATATPIALSATISDNTNVMVLAKYTVDKLKLSAGYEWIYYNSPSDPSSFVTGVSLMDGANTGFNPITRFSAQKPQTFQVFWGGARYAITDSLEVAAAYYRYDQNDATGQAGCSIPTSSGSCNGSMNAASIMLDWKFAPKWDTYIGTFYSESNGGLNAGYLAHENIATTAGVRFRF
jgi:predicted porin